MLLSSQTDKYILCHTTSIGYLTAIHTSWSSHPRLSIQTNVLTASGTIDPFPKPPGAYSVSVGDVELPRIVWGSTAGHTVCPTEQSPPSLSNVSYAYGTVVEVHLTSQFKEDICHVKYVYIVIINFKNFDSLYAYHLFVEEVQTLHRKGE